MKRSLLAISAIALGASLLGLAAPAHAEEAQTGTAVSASGLERNIAHDGLLFPTPRVHAPVSGVIRAGDRVLALCAVQNSGRTWVKIATNSDAHPHGFVSPDTLEGAKPLDGLPWTCPSEVTVVPRTAYARSFGPGEGDFIPTFRCPAGFPYLKNEGGHGAVPGVRVTTTGDSGAHIGLPLQTKGYVDGYSGGTAGNIFGAGGTVSVLATCTSDISLAKKG